TYEEVTRRRIDPALLEYAGGNTFSGRVFPIPAKGFSRVIVAYEELLPVIGDKDVYRFTLPDRKLNEVVFTLQANANDCKEPEILIVGQASRLPEEKAGETHPPRVEMEPPARRGEHLVYERHWTNEGPGGEMRFSFSPPEPRIQVASGRQNE